MFGKFNKLSKKKKLAVVLVSILAILGFAAGWFLLIVNSNRSDKPEDITINYSEENPDESKSNAENYAWRGTPEEPKKIYIDKISVNAYIQKIGVDQHQKVAVPNNVHLAGWFAESQKPGQDGLSIIDGHVSGRSSEGIFKNLYKLTENDEFYVELGNGQMKKYKVIETSIVKEAEAAGVLFSQKPKIKSQLNLITCGGDFDRSTNQYPDRVIVSAELIN